MSTFGLQRNNSEINYRLLPASKPHNKPPPELTRMRGSRRSESAARLVRVRRRSMVVTILIIITIVLFAASIESIGTKLLLASWPGSARRGPPSSWYATTADVFTLLSNRRRPRERESCPHHAAPFALQSAESTSRQTK